MSSHGKVYLTGGGPGDPGLLTVKALQVLKECDVVVYDALVNPALLENCPPSAEKIFAGKRRHRHSFEQKEINALLLKYALEGKKVCRLKGGDPFLFGRGGEEAEFLSKHGVPFEVVPGISSIIAVPAAAGIPLTHRDYASHITVVTGENSSMKEKAPQDRWEPYGYLQKKTLVILMGFAHTEDIVKRLLTFGWPKDTPIALICRGTHADQLAVSGTLKDFPAKVRRLEGVLGAPGLIVAGAAVGMRGKVSPSAVDFDFLPLSRLKAHEGVIPERVKKIKEEISAAGVIETPLWVDREHFIVLNGHHRLAALKEIGAALVPCVLLDYSSPYIEVRVCEGAKIKSIDKEKVQDAALDGKLFPPRSSFHTLRFDPPKVETPVELLCPGPKRSLKA